MDCLVHLRIRVAPLLLTGPLLQAPFLDRLRLPLLLQSRRLLGGLFRHLGFQLAEFALIDFEALNRRVSDVRIRFELLLIIWSLAEVLH